MDVDVAIPAVFVVPADETGIVALVYGRLQRLALADIFATDIDVTGMRTHCETGDQATLYQRMRIVAHDIPVFAGAGLGFVGIDHQIMRPPIALLGHEGPFQTGREPCTATPAQARRLHRFDDPVAALVDQALGTIPMTTLLRAGKRLVELAIEIGEDAILVLQHISLSHLGSLPNTRIYSSRPPLASALACLTQSSRSMRPLNFK